MSRLRRIEIIEPCCPSLLIRESSIFAPKALAFPSFAEEALDLSFSLDFLNPNPNPNPNPFEIFDTITDLIQIERTPFSSSYKRIQHRAALGTEFYLQSLCDRVSALESSFDRLANARIKAVDRKYTWTAEIKDGVERKYKWTAEIKGEKSKKKEKREEKKGGVPKNYKWTTEIEGKGEEAPILKAYTFKLSTGDAGDSSGSGKKEKDKKKKSKKGEFDTRVVEIEDAGDHGALVLRQAFAKRTGAVNNCKGKRKELSPQDAALMIQMSFRAYLIRRSQALRALRELAIAKNKLKELRALFDNFSYRRRIARDAEECQRFSEKIIVLLLTVDAIE